MYFFYDSTSRRTGL